MHIILFYRSFHSNHQYLFAIFIFGFREFVQKNEYRKSILYKTLLQPVVTPYIKVRERHFPKIHRCRQYIWSFYHINPKIDHLCKNNGNPPQMFLYYSHKAKVNSIDLAHHPRESANNCPDSQATARRCEIIHAGRGQN